MNDRLDAVFSLIDTANDEDPNSFRGSPLAMTQGRRASNWLAKLRPDASEPLQIACRAHHLKRWELERSAFPEGRAGYLNWRRTNKKHQAASATKLMEEAGYDAVSQARVTELLLRRDLSTDPEVQILEDIACLVFLETEFDKVTERIEEEKMVQIVIKTLKKMSQEAITAAGEIKVSEHGSRVLTTAVQQMQ